MKQDTDTNFGYWSDRPTRIERPSEFAAAHSRLSDLRSRRERSVWKEGTLIVAIVLTLAVGIVRMLHLF